MYRVGSFVVPIASRKEFLGSLETARAMLRTHEGFVRDVVLERAPKDSETVRIMTLVEWESPEVIERVSAEIAKSYRDRGYDPNARLRELGITKDDALYTPIGI